MTRLRGDKWEKISEKPMTDLCEQRGEVMAVRGRELWRLRGETLEPLPLPETPFPIQRLLSFDETLYLAGEEQVTLLGNPVRAGQEETDRYPQQAWDWGDLPSPHIRDAFEPRSPSFPCHRPWACRATRHVNVRLAW